MNMDDKTLQQALSEHYDIKIKYPPGHLTCNKKHTCLIKEMPLMPSISFRPKERDCEDCGLRVVDRKVHYILKNYHHRNKFWEIKCMACGEKTTTKTLTNFSKS